MFDKIKAMLLGEEEAAVDGPEKLHLATAVLLVEAAVMDGHFDEDERATITTLLSEKFELADKDVTELLDEAANTVAEAAELYSFTRVIRDRFSHGERVSMIEMLWEVAYADRELDPFEDSLIRRVAGLIYVPDKESGEARKRVLERLGLAKT